MKKICIISQRYPCKETPSVHVFVQKLAWAMADQGVEVMVISPVPVWSLKMRSVPEVYEERTSSGNPIKVYRPRFLYAGEKKIGPIRLSHISADTMTKVCAATVRKYQLNPDAFYGHFICVAGICACRLGKMFHKSSFIAYGESTDWSVNNFGLEQVRKETAICNGFVAVSSSNKKRLVEHKIASDAKVGVFVNAVNPAVFYPRDKKEARKKYKLPDDAFIVSYVGQFTERKGITRLIKAVNQCTEVKLICAGTGKQAPDSKNVLFCERIAPQDVPEFLCASDVFVLPTQNEGCSNAVLEAVACGLPVVSSDRDFNLDILDTGHAVLINPDSVKEIAEAITFLHENADCRKKMSEYAVKKAACFTLQERARKILAWMDDAESF